MPKFSYQVVERSTGPGEHSWVAKEIETGDEISLPKGGTDWHGANLVGQYPEIQEHLSRKHGITAALIYLTQIDRLQIHPDGKSTWTFRRQQVEVVVHDIPRLLVGVAITPVP